MSEIPPFDLIGPLPWGVTAIEASAGTGKTFTLASLVVRYIAEADVTADQHLVVTFTRAAATELRDRVRARIAEAVNVLRQPGPNTGDQLLDHLASADGVTRAVWLERLEHALNDFDAATITTIHGFAQQVLSTLGVGAPGDPDARLVDDTSDLVTAVASDQLATLSLALGDPTLLAGLPYGALVAKALAAGNSPADVLPALTPIVETVTRLLGNPGMTLVPDSSDVDDDSTDWSIAISRTLILAIAHTVKQRRRASGTMSFDDVLTQLRDALIVPESGAKEALQRRFSVALIDEFQDTDAVQWDIFSSVFSDANERSSLVLVGDPKQAIYAFRGANVDTYLRAVGAKGTKRYSLPTNWRSNGAVIGGFHALFDGASFGPDIPFVPVSAAASNESKRLLIDGESAPGLAIRLSSPSGYGRDAKGRYLTAGPARTLARADLVNRVLELLQCGQLPDIAGTRAVKPSDLAVLVASNSEAHTYQRALSATGVPAVVLRSGNVFESPAAQQWRRLIAAVAQPANLPRARAAAIGWFFGWTPLKLDSATDSDVAIVQSQLHEWSESLQKRGLTAFFNQVANQSEVATNVLARADGDRSLTDLQHLAEVVQLEAGGRHVSAASLVDLLDELATRKDETEAEATQRRVETDADAVQVITMHSAKGLEFPIVLCPDLYQAGPKDSNQPIVFSRDGRRTLDLRKNTAKGGAPQDARDAATQERRAERLRLAYVAMTRAQHHAIVWWADIRDSTKSPLAKLLFARSDDGTIDPVEFEKPTVTVPNDVDAVAALVPLAARGAAALSISTMPGYPEDPYYRYDPSSSRPMLTLAHRTFDRSLDRVPERWSFTLITNRQASYLEDHGLRADEPVQPMLDTTQTPVSDLLWGDVPGSAAFGTLVHQVFEEVDFTADDLTSEVDSWVEYLGRSAIWPAPTDVITTGIVDAIETPLGSLLGQLPLSAFSRTNRLDELGFELNLGEGLQRALGTDLGALFVRHLDANDPLASWATDVAAGSFAVELAGHMTGSIDAVLRHPTDNTFFVVDYKTNKLSAAGMPATGADYSPEKLPDAMAHHHYPLQGLLYSVALHRFLRWRIADYDPQVHLGGMAYLFVRGMVGPQTPVAAASRFEGHRQGVFSWRPPAQLVVDLSDLLDGSTQ